MIKTEKSLKLPIFLQKIPKNPKYLPPSLNGWKMGSDFAKQRGVYPSWEFWSFLLPAWKY